MSEHHLQRSPAHTNDRRGHEIAEPEGLSPDIAPQVFAEIQRADVKGAAVGATAGAALTAVATILAAAPTPGAPAESLLWCACACFGVALFLAVRALRPTLRSTSDQASPFSVDLARVQAGCHHQSPRTTRATGQRRAEAEAQRVLILSQIAHRKFLLLQASADLFSAGLGVTGVAALVARFAA